MDENVELLEYIYKNSEMGSFTINKLLKELEEKDNKIKKLAKEEMDKYQIKADRVANAKELVKYFIK